MSSLFNSITPLVGKNSKNKVKQHQLKAIELHKNSFEAEVCLKDLCKLISGNKVLQYLRMSGMNVLLDKELNEFSRSLSRNQALKCLDLGPLTENQFMQIMSKI